MSDAVKQFEALKQRIAQVNNRIARADALRQAALRSLEQAKLDAELDFGTSDPDALERMAESARKEAEDLLARTTAQLDDAERQLVAAEKALQS
jgi:predicted  nucleic acid-binding Zn-ribbon protein